MDQVSTFVEMAKHRLKPILSESGKVIYSAASTVDRGDLYLMEYNPGGDPQLNLGTIRESLQKLEDGKDDNDYCDEVWSPYPQGGHPLQRNVKVLFHYIEKDLRTTCASNLIFERTRRAKHVNKKLTDLCWSVHEEL